MHTRDLPILGQSDQCFTVDSVNDLAYWNAIIANNIVILLKMIKMTKIILYILLSLLM